VATSPAVRDDVWFQSGAARCAAWLYRPESDVAPLVVMGHGLGSVKDMGLDRYAERFQAGGLAVLAFDYRHFGASEGKPRQLLDIKRQLEDWAAALAYARRLEGVDPARIAVWGSSFGGGHAITAGARDGRVAAIVAQCPFTSGPASVLAMDPGSGVRVTWLALRDEVSRLRGREGVRVKLVGPPGSTGLMTAPDAEPGYRALIPPGFEFDDEVLARFALRLPFYSPAEEMRRARCPVLVCVCERDTVAPARPTIRAAERVPTAEVIRYPIGHFDIYVGDGFERSSSDQLAFLQRHLGPV
jgi:pimeloyl-ACP methyl ester carboxylesterase